MNKFVIAIVGLIAGAIIGWTLKSTPEPAQVERAEVNTEEGLRKLRDLADKELAEYYQLKSMEEKYKKADELLAKMLTIFLADLGLKLSRETTAASENPAPLDSASKSEAPPNQGLPLTSHGASSPPKQTPPSARQPIADLRTPEEIENFLEQSKPTDFASDLKSAKPFQNRSGNLQNLVGFFVGSANVMKNGHPAVWRVNFRFQGRIEQGKLKGNHRIRMFENGQEFSNKSGNGDLGEDYLEIPSDPQATIVEFEPGGYLQIYYLKQSDSIIGNVIKISKRGGKYEIIGRLNLLRES